MKRVGQLRVPVLPPGCWAGVQNGELVQDEASKLAGHAVGEAVVTVEWSEENEILDVLVEYL